MFSVGIFEIGVVGMLLVAAAILALLRSKAWRWAMIGAACATVATVITPADPASTVLLGSVFLGFFVGGIRFGRERSVAVA